MQVEASQGLLNGEEQVFHLESATLKATDAGGHIAYEIALGHSEADGGFLKCVYDLDKERDRTALLMEEHDADSIHRFFRDCVDELGGSETEVLRYVQFRGEGYMVSEGGEEALAEKTAPSSGVDAPGAAGDPSVAPEDEDGVVTYDNMADDNLYDVGVDAVYAEPLRKPAGSGYTSLTILCSSRPGSKFGFCKTFPLRGPGIGEVHSFAALFGVALTDESAITELIRRVWYARLAIRLATNANGRRVVDVVAKM